MRQRRAVGESEIAYDRCRRINGLQRRAIRECLEADLLGGTQVESFHRKTTIERIAAYGFESAFRTAHIYVGEAGAETEGICADRFEGTAHKQSLYSGAIRERFHPYAAHIPDIYGGEGFAGVERFGSYLGDRD